MAIENLEFRINAAIDAGNSAKTIGELRSSLKDLRDLAAQVGPDNVDAFNKITLAAGNTNDKIKDVRENISALSGTPMERLTNSFGRLRQSIFELDFDKFRQSIIGIKDSFIALGGQALSPFKNLGVAISGLVTGTTTLTAAMRALGGAIAATGIGLLVVSVGLLVAYWDDLKTAGGLIGDTFTAVSNTISGATNALKDFARWLGLIGKGQETKPASREERMKGMKEDLKNELKQLEDNFELEKKVREANRVSVGRTEDETKALRDKYRKEDLEAEKKYNEDIIDVINNRQKQDLEAVTNHLRTLAQKYKYSGIELKEIIDESDRRQFVWQGPTAALTDPQFVEERKFYMEQYQTRLAAEEEFVAFNDKIAHESQINIVKINNQLKDLRQEQTNEQKKNSQELRKQNENNLKQIEKEFQAENDADLERSNQKYQTIKDTNALILEEEYQNAIKRFQIEQELNDKMAASKLNQFDAENLLMSRSQDVFKDYGDFRKKIDEDYAYFAASHAEWTSEQIYEEIFKRYYAQIEAYDAEKQAAINKTNAIIQTAQYGAQALDGINQLVYTLDENRRIAGEMSDKEVAQRAFNRNKAFGIVNAAINTAAGVTAVLASPTNKIDPTGTLQATQIAFVIATGLAQIATISAQKFDASQYNQAPSATTTPSAPEQTVQTGQFANFGDFKPGELEDRRVYVVESDITGIQRKIQVIENRSKF
jgi:phage-related protein